MLDRKLLRDLWAMRAQAVAIAAVMAAGVTMFVAYFSNFDSLQRARAAYYDEARFADVFATLKRAPSRIEARLAAVPGVHAVDTRVVADVTLDVPGMSDPAAGHLISMPERERPRLNDISLRRGRWLDAARPDEVLASELFCESHGLNPGDRLGAIINGRRRELTIVGIVLSPEYVYAIAPGELFPDAKRYGVFWMNRRSLASAFDMEGGFNDVSLELASGTSSPDVIATVDRLLEPYGGRGAIPRSLQISAWTLDNELTQLQTFGLLVPAIFLGVAAFVLHIALTRALALQRSQIAALKALGYSNAAIAWHYVKWALVVAGIAAVTGVAMGAWVGSSFIGIYNAFFRFPTLAYHLSSGLVLLSIAGTLVVAALGAQSAVRRAVRVPPAEAMRPEPPARYRRSIVESRWRPLRLSFAMRMIVRTLERQPMKAFASTIGIAFAVAVLFVGLAFMDVMNVLVEEQFNRTMRQDATLTFAEPRSGRALHDVAHLPGVLEVEPMRTVPARIRAGTRSRTLAITGLTAMPRLMRVIDRTHGPSGNATGRTGPLADARPGPWSCRGGHAACRSAGRTPSGARRTGRRDGRRRARPAGLHAARSAASIAARGRHRFGYGADDGLRRTGSVLCGGQGDACHCRCRDARHGAAELPRHDGGAHEPVDFHQRHLRGDYRLWRCLQLGAGVALGAEPRAGQLAGARLHARGDLAHSARRDCDSDDTGAAIRRSDWVPDGSAHHGSVHQRGVPPVVCREGLQRLPGPG
jgi:putative ABC transport system permease protein